MTGPRCLDNSSPSQVIRWGNTRFRWHGGRCSGWQGTSKC